MPTRDILGPVLLVAVVTLSTAGVVAGAAVPHVDAGDNLTVYTHLPEDRTPGTSDASINRLLTVAPEDAGETHQHPYLMNRTVLYTPLQGECRIQHLRTFAIDHQNNQEGIENWGSEDGSLTLTVNETTTTTVSTASFNDSHGGRLSTTGVGTLQRATITYWTQREAAVENTTPDRKLFRFGANDQMVIAYRNCYTMPDTAGWYRDAVVNRVTARENGTTWTRSVTYSHWYYVCECASYAEAVEVLGAPPGGLPADFDASQDVANDGPGDGPSDGSGPGFGMSLGVGAILVTVGATLVRRIRTQ